MDSYVFLLSIAIILLAVKILGDATNRVNLTQVVGARLAGIILGPSCLGLVEEIPSELMGIGGAISGCGPAFMDMIMESYADAAVKYGIPRTLAYKLIAQTMLGSAKLELQSGSHPGALKDAVCSPGGTTIRGVAALEKAGLRGACIDCIDAIMNK